MQYNKGLAFSDHERDRLYLRGLLPPAVLSQSVQAERVLLNIRGMSSTEQKVVYLMSLQERNERLFFHVLQNNVEEIVPLLQFPAVGQYCKTYSLMFRSLPRGLFLSLQDKGHVFSIIKNWPERRVKAICLTDGECMGTLGDMGVQAIGAPISRLALFTGLGGVDPSTCLPVTIDNGTDNEALLKDPIYVGVRHRRVKGDAYFELIDEFFNAVRRRFGPSVMVDIENMAWDNQSKLLSAYRGTFPMYSDGNHGIPTVALAAIFASQSITGKTLGQHRFLLVGESAGLTAVAELLEEAIQREHKVGTVLEARQAIHIVDSKGLVVRSRADAEELDDHKLPYIQDAAPCPDLLSAVKQIHPTVIIGLSDGRPPWKITREVLEEMVKHCERPVILPMSTDSSEGDSNSSEIRAIDAYNWTHGKCLFADRHTGGELTLQNGQKKRPSIVNTALVFPGVGLGTVMSRSTRLQEGMFVEVARTLARMVSEDCLEKGSLLPSSSGLHDVAAHVAAALAGKAYQAGVATELPRPPDLLERAYAWMWDSAYRSYR